MSKKFLVGVGNVYAYNKSTGDLLFSSRTLLDSSIDITTASTKINGGYGNSLQFVYFHTPEMNMTLTDTQWNLGIVAANVGAVEEVGGKVWNSENVTLGTGGTGTVIGTPIVQPDIGGSTIYGWVTDASGNTGKVTFSGKNFTYASGQSGDVVCVRYYNTNNSASIVTIPANFTPSVVRLVVEAQLASSTSSDLSGSSIIGKTQFEIASAQLSGAQKISMSSNGVSNTPLTANALAADNGVGGCTSGNGVYGRIIEIINNSNWYDNVYALVSTTDPIALTTVNSPYTLDLRAIPTSGSAFKPNYSDLTFTTSDNTKATVSNAGVITKIATGSTTITANITNKPSVSTNIDVTIS